MAGVVLLLLGSLAQRLLGAIAAAHPRGVRRAGMTEPSRRLLLFEPHADPPQWPRGGGHSCFAGDVVGGRHDRRRPFGGPLAIVGGGRARARAARAAPVAEAHHDRRPFGGPLAIRRGQWQSRVVT